MMFEVGPERWILICQADGEGTLRKDQQNVCKSRRIWSSNEIQGEEENRRKKGEYISSRNFYAMLNIKYGMLSVSWVEM